MIKTVEIKSITDLDDIILNSSIDARTGRYRSSSLYRGLTDANYHLTTSLQRNCHEKKDELEKSLLRNFAKYAVYEDPHVMDSIWTKLIIGQHHGLPTRLLDWTYSPLVALHFATAVSDNQTMDLQDCAVWEIDIEEIHSLLPDHYQKKIDDENAYLFTVDLLDDVVNNLDTYDDDVQDNSFVLLEPPSIDQRIINQYSYFSIIPSKMEFGRDNTGIELFLKNRTKKTVKYVIDKSLKWQLREKLDQMNMNERIMYPGLDGLTTWLKRHYYVK